MIKNEGLPENLVEALVVTQYLKPDSPANGPLPAANVPPGPAPPHLGEITQAQAQEIFNMRKMLATYPGPLNSLLHSILNGAVDHAAQYEIETLNISITQKCTELRVPNIYAIDEPLLQLMVNNV